MTGIFDCIRRLTGREQRPNLVTGIMTIIHSAIRFSTLGYPYFGCMRSRVICSSALSCRSRISMLTSSETTLPIMRYPAAPATNDTPAAIPNAMLITYSLAQALPIVWSSPYQSALDAAYPEPSLEPRHDPQIQPIPAQYRLTNSHLSIQGSN